MSDSRRIGAALALWAIAGGTAQAQPDGETGDTLFQQGRAAFAEGKVDLARSYFQRSLRLDPAPGTLLNLAVCEERLGLFVSAVDHLNEALARTAADDKRRTLVLARIAELERVTPRVIVRTETQLAPGVVVTLDDRPVDRATLGKAVRLDPGRHELNCAGPRGEQCPRSFTLTEGQESEQVLEVTTPLPLTQPAPPPTTDSLPPAPRTRDRTLAYALGALGIAGIGTGLVTGALVIDRKNTVAQHCTDKFCDPEGLSAGESGSTLALVSTVATGVGLVALGTSAYLFLSATTATKSTTMISVSGAF